MMIYKLGRWRNRCVPSLSLSLFAAAQRASCCKETKQQNQRTGFLPPASVGVGVGVRRRRRWSVLFFRTLFSLSLSGYHTLYYTSCTITAVPLHFNALLRERQSRG
jgi:hypothetical protein